MKKLAVALAAFGIFSWFSFAQQKSFVLKAARMFDGVAMHTPGLVVVSGTRILAVGSGAPIPVGAEVIDFGDATLSPGFIDAHTHLSGMYNANYGQSLLNTLQKTVPEQTLLATENLKKTLMAGITTVRD